MISLLLAQAAPPPFKDWATAAIVALTPVVVAVLIFFVDQFKSKVPAWVKPLVATGLGALAAYLAGVVPSDPLLVAVIGLATVGLREIIARLTAATGLRKTSRG